MFLKATKAPHNLGECHRLPPIVYFDFLQKHKKTRFPEVIVGDWCGEGKSKPETKSISKPKPKPEPEPKAKP